MHTVTLYSFGYCGLMYNSTGVIWSTPKGPSCGAMGVGYSEVVSWEAFGSAWCDYSIVLYRLSLPTLSNSQSCTQTLHHCFHACDWINCVH